MKFAHAIFAVVLATFSNFSFAEDNVVYFGAGSSKSHEGLSGKKSAFSIGFMHTSDTSNGIFGLDFSREGTMLDSTYGQDQAVKQALSLNLLAGINVARFETGRVDVALLLGGRQKTSDCPESYLGYQCYADAEPDTRYTFNYGAVLAWSYRNVMLGVRATGESTQVLFGLRF